MSRHRIPIEQRFWDKVDKSGDCWIWQGSRTDQGYGRIRAGVTFYKAHRIAYELTYGKIPDSLLVRHKCDNPPCCNPDHLIIGTHADNSDDKIARGRDRYVRGEDQYKSKFTSIDVIAIRKAHAQGDSFGKLAKQYGVTRTAIYCIVHRKNWSHV